jgi:hypothetical protein
MEQLENKYLKRTFSNQSFLEKDAKLPSLSNKVHQLLKG